MNDLKLGPLWKRINDGLPPLEKLIFRGSEIIARIVDETDCRDFDKSDSDKSYSLEKLDKNNDWVMVEDGFYTFDHAWNRARIII